MINFRLQADTGYYLAKLNYHLRVEDPFYFEDSLYDAKGGGSAFTAAWAWKSTFLPWSASFLT